MSALAANLQSEPNHPSVTKISANARVDYIQRFSKQAVLVIDEQMSNCSSIGNQMLANLSPEYNAAYVNVSNRLDDVQIRCRVVEQLYGQVLFDPEQSLAVSLINFIKKHKQPICVVVENAHFLSLQLLHELSQLAEIGKKADYVIEVLMLALPEVGLKISQHQPMFKNKLSMVNASTGQLIAQNSKQFKSSGKFFEFTPLKKWLLFLLILSIAASAVIFNLYQRDVMSFSQLINKAMIGENVVENSLLNPLVTKTSDTEFAITEEKRVVEASIHATPSDIINALAEKQEASIANESDILSSLVLENNGDTTATAEINELNLVESKPTGYNQAKNDVQQNTNELASGQVKPLVINTPENINAADDLKEQEPNELSEQALSVESTLNSKPLSVNTTSSEKVSSESYYADKTGVVLQISGFTQQSVLEEFLADFAQIEFHQYQRLVNGNEMTILTSKVYANRAEAEQALLQLPQVLIERSPWIKGVSVINQEIAQYQSSQSSQNQDTIAALSQ